MLDILTIIIFYGTVSIGFHTCLLGDGIDWLRILSKDIGEAVSKAKFNPDADSVVRSKIQP